MNILHTSDWHLGRQLYGQNRHAEFEAFLQWLDATLQAQKTDVLIVAGDVFDTITPNHGAQQLYYQFLAKVATDTHCRHIIIIGGNHDSAGFLNAPKSLLSALKVTVIGAMPEHLQDELLVLNDAQGQACAIVCAVPYLRDKDVRLSLDNQSGEDKQQALLLGITQHYQNLYQLADAKRQALGLDIPIIATGHLFTQGGQTLQDDGVRELYVGTLAHVGVSAFEGFDYVALGHLHVPQTVGDAAHIRYSGSPIAMGFGEAKQQKQVVHIAFTGRLPDIQSIDVPCFHALARVSGDQMAIQTQLQALMDQQQPVYVEVVYQGNGVVADLAAQLHALVQNSAVEILRIHNRQYLNHVLPHDSQEFSLPDLSPEEVFEACLEQHNIDPDQRPVLRASHQMVLAQIQQQDLSL